MKFHLIEDNLIENWFHLKVSENNIWQIYLYPVAFGFRIQVGKVGSSGPEIDYCGGMSEEGLELLYTQVQMIMEKLPEWSFRPVWKDEDFMSKLQKISGYTDQETEDLPSLALIQD